MQTKQIQIDKLELKFKEGKEGFFSGYASVFGGVDSYGDTIIKGAYVNTLADRERPIAMRWNHYGPVIGKWTSIVEDEKGLYVEGELTPNHSVAGDVYASLKHGAISGMSIGYRPITVKDIGNGQKELHEIELIEISVVESPADLSAQVDSVKTDLTDAVSLKEIEKILRDAGFSRADSTLLVSRVKAIAHGERDVIDNTNELIATIKAATNHITQKVK